MQEVSSPRTDTRFSEETERGQMIEVLKLHPPVDPNDRANKNEWTPDRFLKRGEYDLVNIALLDYDPNSGWSYDRCQEAWNEALIRAQEMERTIKWWQLLKHIKLRLLIAALLQRRGY